MITVHNVTTMTTAENLIADFLAYCPELLLNKRVLTMYSGSLIEADKNIFATLMNYGQFKKYNTHVDEFMRDYATLADLYQTWLMQAERETDQNLAMLAQLKAFNVKHDMINRAEGFALWSQFHEAKH